MTAISSVIPAGPSECPVNNKSRVMFRGHCFQIIKLQMKQRFKSICIQDHPLWEWIAVFSFKSISFQMELPVYW